MTAKSLDNQVSDKIPKDELPDYPPILDLVMPVIFLVFTVTYAWSLVGIRIPEMNLLLLRPLFVVVWILMVVVFVREIVPSLRMQRAWLANLRSDVRPRHEYFMPGTQLGAALVLLATLVFSFFGPGDGDVYYIVSVFTYVVVVGMLMGDRSPLKLIIRAAAITMLLYVVMGLVLGVRL